jgi:uncharacterized membrane protein
MSVEITPGRKDRTIKRLVANVQEDASLLVRQEIALAKAELKEKVQSVAKQAGLFGAAGVLGYTGLLILCAALILGIIALGVAAWLATLGVGMVVMAGTILLVQRARHIGKSSPQ